MKAKRILIADDDATLVRILEVRMRNLGFDTQASHDAMHALTMVHKNPPDLPVIVDVMPAGDGLTVCQTMCLEN
ncbi:response regulator [Planctomycetota bacterium]|nr:response regulator [Planctomycetota bacterium]